VKQGISQPVMAFVPGVAPGIPGMSMTVRLHNNLNTPDVANGYIAGAAAPVDTERLAEGGPSCPELFSEKMSKFVPTIRDIINEALMSRTATTLATAEGQESLKKEIKDKVNPIINPTYAVIRVNFQDFIIQK